MYCSSCGSAVAGGLSYCNRCGAEVGAKSTKNASLSNAPPFPEALVWAITGVSVGGLGVLIGLMAVMKQALHFENGVIVAFSLLSFLILLVAEISFIWLLVSTQRRAHRRDEREADIAEVKGAATKELGVPQERLLTEPVSITEHTTRTLEPVYRESKTE